MSSEERNHETTAERIVSHASQQVCDTADQLGAAVSRIGNKVEDGLDDIEARVVDLKETVSDKGSQITRASKRFVRKNPWAAAGVAFVLGLIVARKKKH